MNFILLEKSPGAEFMCKNELFQSSSIKNELLKIQKQKPNFIQSLGTKTIV